VANAAAATRKVIKKFYKKQIALDEPLRKIAEIPFNLIVSLMPDDRLRNKFDEQGFPYKFDFYSVKSPMQRVDFETTPEEPLIYNLLGNFAEQDITNFIVKDDRHTIDDIIITFDDMFKFLKEVLSNGLPSAVGIPLSRARTIVFLGVHFERWHTQLLLKIIAPAGDILKYNISKNYFGEKDRSKMCVFISEERLGIQFIPENPIHFLDLIYQECKKNNLLKGVSANDQLTQVFLSYNHNDQALALSLGQALEKQKVKVILDETEMMVGDNIEQFITRISEVDCLVPIISRNSLLSRYVIEEIHTAMEMGKLILPYYLDSSIDDDAINAEKQKLVNEKVNEIGLMYSAPVQVPNLEKQRNMWLAYNNNFHTVVSEIKKLKGAVITLNNVNLIAGEIAKTINAKK
jgi:hypothetical protein